MTSKNTIQCKNLFAKLLYSHINDVVGCLVHALENEKITGYEYALRGSTSITFDGILETLSKHCEMPNYVKCPRSYITGFMEKMFIGRTHDKNMVLLLIS